MKLYQLSAFTARGAGGNMAGVVLDADGLPEAEMQSVARRLGYSETAFVMNSPVADYRVRFFTPAAEVELCGHATIAAFTLLYRLGRLVPGSYRQDTRAGVMGVEVGRDGEIYMDQELPTFGQVVPAIRVAHSLGLDLDDIDEAVPVQVVSTGLRDIIIPVRSLNALQSIRPRFEEIAEISREYGTVGYHVFTLETLSNGNTAHCRNFAPLYDIPEEAATGTSNGALACYLLRHKLVPGMGRTFAFEQGYIMGSPSEILAAIERCGDIFRRVQVGGRALVVGECSLEVNH